MTNQTNQQSGFFLLGFLLACLAVIGIGAAMIVYGSGSVAFGGGIVAFLGLMMLVSWYKTAVSAAFTSMSSHNSDRTRF